ncbi:MAG: biotin transporter BioY [Oscillospiraceae bacterium]|jgi:biotin transport system substrate-specific component|nr:biotin transporter BioY [Oscillospiraceae bacterium]
MKLDIRKLTHTALFAALMCVAAPLSVPIGPVPLSLATLVIYLAATALGGRLAALATAVYILCGALGLPVFSGFGAGLSKLVGPTGGYILGYVPLAFIAGTFAERGGLKLRVVGMVVGTAVLYAMGTAWFMRVTGAGLTSALTLCVVPFIPGDAVKIAVSASAIPLARLYTSR